MSRKPLGLAPNRVLVTFLLILCVTGCASSGTFDKAGFTHPEHPYRVRPAADAQLMPPDWQLDNYRDDLILKRGPDYESTLFVDANNDGTRDNCGTVSTFDLRFTHRRNAGIVWLRTVPIPKNLEAKELRILAQSYVDGIAGTHYEVVQLGGELSASTKERRFATSIVDSAAGQVAEREAYAVTFDVADVDQLQLSKGQVRHRVRLVLIRTPFVSEFSRGQLPVVMIAGYSNLPEDFDGLVADFQNFLERITIGKATGAQFQAPAPNRPERIAAPPASAERSAAPPASKQESPEGAEHVAPTPTHTAEPANEVPPGGGAFP